MKSAGFDCKLKFIKPFIDWRITNEFMMRTSGYDAPFVKHQDQIRIHDSRKAVGDYEAGPPDS